MPKMADATRLRRGGIITLMQTQTLPSGRRRALLFDMRAEESAIERSLRLQGGESRLMQIFVRVADNLLDRTQDFNREFKRVLDCSSHHSLTRARCLNLHPRVGGEDWVFCNRSVAMTRFRIREAEEGPTPNATRCITSGEPSDQESPLGGGGFDLVLSHLFLHRQNDLAAEVRQLRQALAPGGLLLASVAGPQTLEELRYAFLKAELKTRGGGEPHLAPLPEMRDLGRLLQGAGFALPVLDRDLLRETWPDARALMHDLRAVGAVNVLSARRKSCSPRAAFLGLDAEFARAAGSGVRATFEVITLAAWAPDGTEQKALKRGSAEKSLAEALKEPNSQP